MKKGPEKGPEARGDGHIETGLRSITPVEITDYLQKKWDTIEVEILPLGQKKIVQPGWHGAGYEYEARVDFQDLLTTPIAGTYLSPEALTKWLSDKGFLFEHGNTWMTWQDAAKTLGSDEFSRDNVPIFRAWRRDGVPIEIEYYNGSRNDKLQRLTELGNLPSLTQEQREEYTRIVDELTDPFISKGTTKVAKHLGLADGYRRVARKDDCLAASSTYVADKIVSYKLSQQAKQEEQTFWVDDVVLATSQSLVVLIDLAERYKTPLLIRAGAPSFGLGGTKDDLNYMRNTQPEMLRYGLLTSGDFGNNMISFGKTPTEPVQILYGDGSHLRETVFFLRGGGPIMDLMFRSLDGRHKRHQGVISIRQAKRIHRDFDHWSVILTGVHQISEDDYNPRYWIPAGATLQEGKCDTSGVQVFSEGMEGKLVRTEKEHRVIQIINPDGKPQVVYEPIPTKQVVR